jgi:chromosome segregation protein
MLRREELERVVESREEGIRGYEESISRLTDESGDLLSQLDELKEKAASFNIAMDDERVKRAGMMERIAAADQAVAERRAGLDQARDFRSKLDVQAAESTMRRQNVYDHLQDEYGLFADAVMRESDPKWKNGVVPPMEELEGTVARLQSEIAALGPVNMVAIDECRELEERYAREKAQEEDLLAAKAQLVELINNLNLTSGDMFKTTFEQANRNFQTMFTKLFGGGEARLVLLENSEDPLECGIDIIARPPGKRPQSVTLLSGGERTMTAVALLFSIFMIKPAPFCMLDELDAALDDANIGRFVEQLKEFLVQSQFLIITHNQHTIAGSDLVYGVSQQEKGVSRVISMKLSDLGVKAKK